MEESAEVDAAPEETSQQQQEEEVVAGAPDEQDEAGAEAGAGAEAEDGGEAEQPQEDAGVAADDAGDAGGKAEPQDEASKEGDEAPEDDEEGKAEPQGEASKEGDEAPEEGEEGKAEPQGEAKEGDEAPEEGEEGEAEPQGETEVAAEPEAEAEPQEPEAKEEAPAASSPHPEAPAELAEVLSGYSAIPPEDRAEFCEAFRLVSEEADSIAGRDVRQLMQALGQDSACQDAVEQLMAEQGLDADSRLDFAEAVGLVAGSYRPQAEVSADLMRSFKVFDRNGNGYLEYDELYRAMFLIGDQVLEQSARDDFDELVRLVDKNQDGKIDYSEFCQMVTVGVGELRRRMAADE